MLLTKESVSGERNFGLELSFDVVEKVPLMLVSPDAVQIQRIGGK